MKLELFIRKRRVAALEAKTAELERMVNALIEGIAMVGQATGHDVPLPRPPRPLHAVK